MPRRAARVDRNQSEIVEAFRRAGASVEITSGAHDGFTDIVVGCSGVTVLVEIKDGALPPSRRKLTAAQQIVHDRFTGAITVVETVDQALALVRRMKRAGQILRSNNVQWGPEGGHEG